MLGCLAQRQMRMKLGTIDEKRKQVCDDVFVVVEQRSEKKKLRAIRRRRQRRRQSARTGASRINAVESRGRLSSLRRRVTSRRKKKTQKNKNRQRCPQSATSAANLDVRLDVQVAVRKRGHRRQAHGALEAAAQRRRQLAGRQIKLVQRHKREQNIDVLRRRGAVRAVRAREGDRVISTESECRVRIACARARAVRNQNKKHACARSSLSSFLNWHPPRIRLVALATNDVDLLDKLGRQHDGQRRRERLVARETTHSQQAS